jgi:hypothetical protein
MGVDTPELKLFHEHGVFKFILDLLVMSIIGNEIEHMLKVFWISIKENSSLGIFLQQVMSVHVLEEHFQL